MAHTPCDKAQGEMEKRREREAARNRMEGRRKREGGEGATLRVREGQDGVGPASGIQTGLHPHPVVSQPPSPTPHPVLTHPSSRKLLAGPTPPRKSSKPNSGACEERPHVQRTLLLEIPPHVHGQPIKPHSPLASTPVRQGTLVASQTIFGYICFPSPFSRGGGRVDSVSPGGWWSL